MATFYVPSKKTIDGKEVKYGRSGADYQYDNQIFKGEQAMIDYVRKQNQPVVQNTQKNTPNTAPTTRSNTNTPVSTTKPTTTQNNVSNVNKQMQDFSKGVQTNQYGEETTPPSKERVDQFNQQFTTTKPTAQTTTNSSQPIETPKGWSNQMSVEQKANFVLQGGYTNLTEKNWWKEQTQAERQAVWDRMQTLQRKQTEMSAYDNMSIDDMVRNESELGKDKSFNDYLSSIKGTPRYDEYRAKQKQINTQNNSNQLVDTILKTSSQQFDPTKSLASQIKESEEYKFREQQIQEARQVLDELKQMASTPIKEFEKEFSELITNYGLEKDRDDIDGYNKKIKELELRKTNLAADLQAKYKTTSSANLNALIAIESREINKEIQLLQASMQGKMDSYNNKMGEVKLLVDGKVKDYNAEVARMDKMQSLAYVGIDIAEKTKGEGVKALQIIEATKYQIPSIVSGISNAIVGGLNNPEMWQQKALEYVEMGLSAEEVQDVLMVDMAKARGLAGESLTFKQGPITYTTKAEKVGDNLVFYTIGSDGSYSVGDSMNFGKGGTRTTGIGGTGIGGGFWGGGDSGKPTTDASGNIIRENTMFAGDKKLKDLDAKDAFNMVMTVLEQFTGSKSDTEFMVSEQQVARVIKSLPDVPVGAFTSAAIFGGTINLESVLSNPNTIDFLEYFMGTVGTTPAKYKPSQSWLSSLGSYLNSGNYQEILRKTDNELFANLQSSGNASDGASFFKDNKDTLYNVLNDLDNLLKQDPSLYGGIMGYKTKLQELSDVINDNATVMENLGLSSAVIAEMRLKLSGTAVTITEKTSNKNFLASLENANLSQIRASIGSIRQKGLNDYNSARSKMGLPTLSDELPSTYYHFIDKKEEYSERAKKLQKMDLNLSQYNQLTPKERQTIEDNIVKEQKIKEEMEQREIQKILNQYDAVRQVREGYGAISNLLKNK